jgi:hypothetical protein
LPDEIGRVRNSQFSAGGTSQIDRPHQFAYARGVDVRYLRQIEDDSSLTAGKKSCHVTVQISADWRSKRSFDFKD